MPSPPDRPIHVLEMNSSDYPLSPLNVFCQSSFILGSYDIRWSPPSQLRVNANFDIIGVNIYRSFDSEFGPYTRINALPVGTDFYRDNTRICVQVDEEVTNKFISTGQNGPTYEWTFRTDKYPLFIHGPTGEADLLSLNVQVRVGNTPANILSIKPEYGEVTLSPHHVWDPITETSRPSPLPMNGERVFVTYRYLENEIRSSLGSRVFYRVTTVGRDKNGQLLETPVDKATVSNNDEVEKLDYIWREAIRRNRFILVQGGERVKIFIRKSQGNVCGCVSAEHKQPSSDCKICFATGIVGGYEGPFDSIIAPDDAARSIDQESRGRSLKHEYETWTSPTPLLSHRDFIVKLNGERYAIGAVRMPSNRGMQLQQHFTISHFDSSDIRYSVPVMDTSKIIIPHTRWIDPSSGKSLPMVTERSSIGDEREERGNTVAWENTQRRG